jgi:leucyl aminopeptidase
MKGDMSGAAAVLAAMTGLSALGCTAEVTGYLMCTDNMPSGTAMKLGDVLTIRGGTTIEVINTDAEGRLVMADGLVLSTELDPRPDAIVDIATLTGACQRALGVLCAGVMGNDQQLIDQVIDAAERTDESVWQLPLEHRYRKELDSQLADMKNVGGENAGAITAALFLEEFVDGIPWAHIDIAGTANLDTEETWRPKGQTGFGARLLLDFLMRFKAPAVH